jgi:cation transport ATPase
MLNQNTSFFSQYQPPYLQAAVGLGSMLIFMLLGKISGMNITFHWTAAGAVLLMFSVFNSVNSFTAKNMLTYYRDSIFSYMALVGLGSLMAYFFSSVTINEAGTFKWIFFMITLSYFGFIGIVSFIRFIISVLETEQEKLSKQKED